MRHAIRPALLLSLLLAAAPARGENVSPSPSQPPHPTYQALERLAEALRERSLPALDSLLTADNTLHVFRDGLARFRVGRSRGEALDSLRAWFAAAPGLTVFADGLSEAADPEHADSLEHYRLLIVRRFDAKRAGGEPLMGELHVLHLVRGDAALRTRAQVPDPQRWYVRRWLLDLSPARRALLARRESCHAPAALAPGAADRTTFTVQPDTGTACATLTLRGSRPRAGALLVEVLDVQGRPVQRIERPTQPAGGFLLEAGAGATLLPGIYWVRLTSGAEPPIAQLVLVSR